MDAKDFWTKLDGYLEDVKLPMGKLSAASGVSYNTLYGQRRDGRFPKEQQLQRLAKTLNMTVGQLKRAEFPEKVTCATVTCANVDTLTYHDEKEPAQEIVNLGPDENVEDAADKVEKILSEDTDEPDQDEMVIDLRVPDDELIKDSKPWVDPLITKRYISREEKLEAIHYIHGYILTDKPNEAIIKLAALAAAAQDIIKFLEEA